MAYDANLAKRIDEFLIKKPHFTRKEMFGGVGYLLNGNMCIGIHKSDLIVRFNPKQTDELMKRSHVRSFDITGRPMKGWLLVDGEEAAKDLNTWFEIAFAYVKTLPGK